MTSADLLPDATLAVGAAVEDWTGDARYFEYSRAANPVGSGRVTAIPMGRFPAALHRGSATGVIALDQAEAMAIHHGPATSPALLASFVRMAAGQGLTTDPVATSELFYVMAGAGTSEVDGRVLPWAAGDLFVLPGGGATRHHATAETTLYWVTDEPLLRELGVAPTGRRFRPTLFPAARTEAELAAVVASPHALDRNRLAVLLNTTPNDATQTVTHVLWAMLGLLPEDAVQRPHRHQSVALDLVVACEPGCYTLVGRSLDDDGEIVAPTRVDWEAGGAFVTPPGLWHAHHNESGAPARILPIQDAGLHTYLRTLDIRFAPPRRTG